MSSSSAPRPVVPTGPPPSSSSIPRPSSSSRPPSSSSSSQRPPGSSSSGQHRPDAGKGASSSSSQAGKSPFGGTVKRAGHDFPCSITFQNPLPPLPFPLKLLQPNFPKDRHYKDVYGTIHSTTPIPYVTKDGSALMPSTPLKMGLMWRKEPFTSKKDQLDPKDLELLAPYRSRTKEEEAEELRLKQEVTAKPIASWLRRSEVISSDIQLGKSRAEMQNKLHQKLTQASPPKKYAHLPVAERFAKTVEATFEVAARAHVSTLRHPTKPKLTATEILPVFPDFENRANRYRLVVYPEGDPVQNEKKQIEDPTILSSIPLEEAIIKPIRNPNDPTESYIAYYAPTSEAVTKIHERRMAEDEDEDETSAEALEFQHIRDFTFKQMMRDVEEPMIFIEIRQDEGGAFYTPLGDRMVLKKKRALSRLHYRGNDDEEEWEKATHYNVSFRPFTKSEKRRRREILKEVLLRGEVEMGEEEEGGPDDEDEDDENADAGLGRKDADGDTEMGEARGEKKRRKSRDEEGDGGRDDAAFRDIQPEGHRGSDGDDDDEETSRVDRKKRKEEKKKKKMLVDDDDDDDEAEAEPVRKKSRRSPSPPKPEASAPAPAPPAASSSDSDTSSSSESENEGFKNLDKDLDDAFDQDDAAAPAKTAGSSSPNGAGYSRESKGGKRPAVVAAVAAEAKRSGRVVDDSEEDDDDEDEEMTPVEPQPPVGRVGGKALKALPKPAVRDDDAESTSGSSSSGSDTSGSSNESEDEGRKKLAAGEDEDEDGDRRW
ncbi:hypothetical protein HDU96_007925 [Phlyctochytrium bullatum]|nr:hypothetical protein HDU96_007925 [Phlyctochytrium bullatum]